MGVRFAAYITDCYVWATGQSRRYSCFGERVVTNYYTGEDCDSWIDSSDVGLDCGTCYWNYTTTTTTPDPTADPTREPTYLTADPTYDPTFHPTFDPTADPTADPTSEPTEADDNTTDDSGDDSTTDDSGADQVQWMASAVFALAGALW